MTRRGLGGWLVTALSVSALVVMGAAEAKPTRARRRATSPMLITLQGVAGIQLGMSLSAARARLPGATLKRTRDGDGRALVAVSKGKRTLLILDAGEQDPDGPIDWKARIDWISVVDPAYATRDGVRTGMLLKDVEKRYGRLIDIRVNEIEAREYASFARSPKTLWLRAASEGGMAGFYPGADVGPHAHTRKYRPDARILHIEISTSSHE